MARRKKKSKKRAGGGGSRRRRMGAISSDAMLGIGTLLGGIGLMIANDKIKKKDGTKPLQGKLPGIAELLLGGVMVWKGGTFVKGLGLGFLVAGGANTGRSFGFLSGIGLGAAPREFRNGVPMRGFRDVPAVGAPFPKPNVVGRANIDKIYGGVYR